MPPVPETLSEAGRWLVVAVALAILAIIGYYAVNAIMAVGIMAAILLVVGVIVWIVGGRLWDWARHGKPLVRRDWRSTRGGDE